MFVGTGSDVGKSIIATAFCRIFKQDGYNPAPFKAQNMALNSFVTADGLELGRAQAVQAEAAGVPCHTDMNPLLLKPSGDCTSQVVLHGRPIGNRDSRGYFSYEKESMMQRAMLEREVHAAYDRLAVQYNPIVIEGAGSISELNLDHADLPNMPMAKYANADVILVADIDRGGVFASVYGSIVLQKEEYRKRIKGIIINKFRGDISLFQSGIKILENLCKIPVLGVIPYYKDIYIEEEDSVMLRMKNIEATKGKVNIAVVLLHHISNFTDFNTLERDERVHLFYTNNTDEIKKANIIIIPGTKNTIDDLIEIRRNGVAQAILQAYRDGATILGICGGYQIMGIEICDPQHIETDKNFMPGLGLLPVTTTLSDNKITRQTTFRMPDDERECRGYEIHSGQTKVTDTTLTTALLTRSDSADNGIIYDRRCFGTYIHGILDNIAAIDFLLRPFVAITSKKTTFDYAKFKDEQYNLLAAHVRKNIDLKKIYEIIS